MNSSNKALIRAAHDLDLELFEMVVADGIDIHASVDSGPFHNSAPLVEVGNEALHAAIRATKEKGLNQVALQIVRRLLDIGVEVNAISQASTALSLAVYSYQGNYDLIQLLFDRGAKVQSPDILSYAAQAGVETLIRQILAEGDLVSLPPDEKKRYYEEALCVAARYGHKAIVEILLDAGVSADSREMSAFKSTNTALMNTAVFGHADIVNLLLERGADIEAKGDRGMTVFLAAAQGGLTELALKLLAAGADFRASDFMGRDALSFAAAQGNEVLAHEIVACGASVTTKSRTGSIIESAASGGMVWLIELCLQAGINADVQNDWGYTPLMSAAQNGCIEAMEFLIARGANVNHVAHYQGETALNYAVRGKHIEATRWLIEQGADINAEMGDILHGNMTPLMNAATFNQPELIEVLIEGGADVNHKESEVGYSALHSAASEGAVEAMEMLLRYGADVNILSAENSIPLNHAAASGKVEVMRLLIEAGSKIDVHGVDGTSLLEAITFGHLEAVQFLLEVGANPDIPDRHGNTILQIAEERGHLRIIEYLTDVRPTS